MIAAATVLALPLYGAAGYGPAIVFSVGAGLLLAIVQAAFALRVAFDAALFRRLAVSPDLTAFDAAMIELKFLPASKAGRPVAARIAGAKRLMVLQGLALAGQIALPVVSRVDRLL